MRLTAGRLFVAMAMAGTVGIAGQGQRAGGGAGEWRAYAGDNASTKYSRLAQINRDNVKNLRIAWRQPVIPGAVQQIYPNLSAPNASQNTPLMVGGLLYVSTGVGTVAALDASTGTLVWHDTPPQHDETVRPTRGLSYWTDGKDARILAIVGQYLVALNAKTGKRYATFGDGGHVDLRKGYRRPFERYSWRGQPTIVRDVAVVGSSVNDVLSATQRSSVEGEPGDVRGYDVRTGKLLWTFHTVPRPGEFGNETWLNDSWAYTGHTNVWSWMTADEQLGYVYLPLTTPTNDWYGGQRHGDNLFAESLVCLDAKTGKRIWHFQAVHHGLWDYDFPTAPILADVRIDGRMRQIIAQPSKQAFLYVFDRVTGQPIWPIEEKPVPQTRIPGEWTSPTQPFPSRPPAYDQQGVTIDDLIDFTPELRKEAIEIISQYEYGPLFTPPSVADEKPGGKKGTIQMPGSVGGTNWVGAALDPETGILYVPSVKSTLVIDIVKPDPKFSNVDRVRRGYQYLSGPQGLPLFKPPYGRIVAIDLKDGSILWTVPNGEGPRDHPALKHLNLPWLGQGGRAAPLVTQTLLFLGDGPGFMSNSPPGSGGKKFRAYEKSTGKLISEIELPGAAISAPMTYLAGGKQYIAITVGWTGMPAELVALALP
jgi:quinoprotein glucose dehydrogenase